MLSICLPIYNVNVIKLVEKLIHQAETCKIDFEIRLYDDGSKERYKCANNILIKYKQVVYFELEKNLGSAAIRNRLLKDSLFENILFLDSDSDIQDNYIQLYLPYLKQEHLIVCGGRIHPIELPAEQYSLRWKVGKEREDYSANIRNHVPNKSFMSNNFLVKKELFDIVSFNEEIKRSGHEDTMYGIELEKKEIEIIHIDNPVTHIGLETNDEFITKTRQRLDTLKYLAQINNEELIFQRITLLKVYRKIKYLHLPFLLRTFYSVSKPLIETNLKSKKPSMLLYDLYKIGYYSTL